MSNQIVQYWYHELGLTYGLSAGKKKKAKNLLQFNLRRLKGANLKASV